MKREFVKQKGDMLKLPIIKSVAGVHGRLVIIVIPPILFSGAIFLLADGSRGEVYLSFCHKAPIIECCK